MNEQKTRQMDKKDRVTKSNELLFLSVGLLCIIISEYLWQMIFEIELHRWKKKIKEILGFAIGKECTYESCVEYFRWQCTAYKNEQQQ